MPTRAEMIAGTFRANLWILERHAADLTHAESLLQPPFPANSLNWTIGHIVASRHRALALLGRDGPWDEATRQVYGGKPPGEGDKLLALEDLMGALAQTQKALNDAFEALDDAALDDAAGERTVGQQLHGLAWHETYHTGQTEQLRKLAGRNEQIIP